MLCVFLSCVRRYTMCALVTGVRACALPILVDPASCVVAGYFGALAGMDQPHRRRMELHRPRQADPERFRRELQRTVPRGMPERGGVHHARRYVALTRRRPAVSRTRHGRTL